MLTNLRLGELRLTTAQQRSAVQNLLSDLYLYQHHHQCLIIRTNLSTYVNLQAVKGYHLTANKLTIFIYLTKPQQALKPIGYRALSTLLHATVYVTHNLLNALVQIANKMGFKKNI
jgi:hypothetical protein